MDEFDFAFPVFRLDWPYQDVTSIVQLLDPMFVNGVIRLASAMG
jgi:hypothetical protein